MINHGGSWTCTCTHHWLVHQFEYNFNPSRWIFIITLRIWRSKLIPILHFALVKVISISNYKYWRSAKEKLQIYALSFSFLFPLLYVMYFFWVIWLYILQLVKCVHQNLDLKVSKVWGNIKGLEYRYPKHILTLIN